MARNGTASNGTVPVPNGKISYAAKHNLADHFIGGNKLENAVAGPVKDFVAAHDGHTVITNVCCLLYGRRAFLTYSADSDCQQWNCSSQGDSVGAEMGLRNIRR